MARVRITSRPTVHPPLHGAHSQVYCVPRLRPMAILVGINNVEPATIMIYTQTVSAHGLFVGIGMPYGAEENTFVPERVLGAEKRTLYRRSEEVGERGEEEEDAKSNAEGARVTEMIADRNLYTFTHPVSFTSRTMTAIAAGSSALPATHTCEPISERTLRIYALEPVVKP